MTERKENIFKYINTILLSIMSLIMMYGVGVLNKLSDSQKQNEIAIAVMVKTISSHNAEAANWVAEIKSNENRLDKLEQGHTAATYDRFTKTEALEAIQKLKEWVEKNYEKK